MNVIMQEVILTLQLLIIYISIIWKHRFLLRLTHISLAIQTDIPVKKSSILVSVNKN